MSVSKQSAFSTAQKQPKLFPCRICKKPTDQTCSLCRKVFYCSAQHQEIDWHMKHKTQCEGKIIQQMKSPSESDKLGQFGTGETGMTRSAQYISGDIQHRSNQVRLQNESREWMKVFEQRLIERRKCVDSYRRFIQQQITPHREIEPVEQELRVLTDISLDLLQRFKPQFTAILEQNFGMTTSKLILQLDYLLDLILLHKFYSFAQRHEQVRKFLLNIHQYLPDYPIDADERYRQIYDNCLKSILQLSQKYCNDKISQLIMAKFILLIQRFEGIMERVYVYFNMGNWYLNKTYFHKAIKCFNHSIDLIQTHISRSREAESHLLIKSNILFNLSLSQYEVSQQQNSYSNMQQCYRLRVKTIGKNSIESSHCLYVLSQWTFNSKEWQDCLQYAKECYRIRKLNKDNYPEELFTIQKFLQSVYAQLKQERDRNMQEMNTQNIKYYETIISPNINQREVSISQPQQSFIKQLNSSVKQELIQFKLVVTPQMAETYSSKQWEKLTKLLEIDQLMHKQEIRKIIFESQFTQSLNQAQRDAFIKANLIE